MMETAVFKWLENFPGSVTVCDRKSIVVFMNEKSELQFEKYGGKNYSEKT